MRRIMALASKYYTRAVKGAQYRMNRGVRPYASNLNTLMPRPEATYRSGRPSSSRTVDSCVPPAGAGPLVELRARGSSIDTLTNCVSLTVSGPLIGS